MGISHLFSSSFTLKVSDFFFLLSSVADTLQNAITASYNKVEKIHFGNAYCRRDIGQKALKALEN